MPSHHMLGPRRQSARTLSVEDNRAVIDDLQRFWFAEVKKDEFRARTLSPGRVAFTFAATVHARARAANLLWEQSMWSESAPLARSCFESALHAAWIREHGGDGIPELLAEYTRHGDNRREQWIKAGVVIPPDLADAIASARRLHQANAAGRKNDPRAVRRANEIGGMKSMCENLGGPSMYALYRDLCSSSHALGPMNLHLEVSEDEEVQHHVLPTGTDSHAAMNTAIVAYSVVWATRAWSELNVNKPGKQRIRAAARKLDIDSLPRYEAQPLRRENASHPPVKVKRPLK